MKFEKIQNIEFLRIIGCLAIILHHMFCRNLINNLDCKISIFEHFQKMTISGYMAVDLFFILAGFFLGFKLNTEKSMFEFLKTKLIRLYPVIIFVLLVSYILHLFGIFKFDIYNGIFSLLCLNGTNFVTNAGAGREGGVLWFVSVLLFVLCFYYYLLKNYQRKTVNLIIALIVYASYSLLVYNRDFGNVTVFAGLIFNVGMFRGLGAVGVGYFISQWYRKNYEKIKNLSLSVYNKLFLSVLEFICIFFIINNLMFHKPVFKNKFVFILVFTVTIVLFLFNKGYISKLLNNINWSFLSKYTYSLYVTHALMLETIKYVFWNEYKEFLISYPIFNIVLTMGLVILVGIAVYHMVEKPAANYLKNI